MDHRYGTRTAEVEAAFFLPYLRPGMRLLDLGCGPGTITIGLADAVAPAPVVGVDHDVVHLEAAQARAAEAGITNVTFELGDAYALPFHDASFDAAFENSVFIHLSRPVDAARNVYRVLRPGGVFGTRDTCMDGVVSGHPGTMIEDAYRLFYRWHRARGSNLKVGKHMPRILRQAGFGPITVGASCGLLSGADAVAEHARTMGRLFEPGGSIRTMALERGWAHEARIDGIAAAWRRWGNHPDSFFAGIMCELVASKS